MTKAEFDTVAVGDVLLAQNGRHMHITDIAGETLYFYWEAGVMDPGDPAGKHINHYKDFAYISHISKGTNYGTYRTLRHEADFKAKP